MEPNATLAGWYPNPADGAGPRHEDGPRIAQSIPSAKRKAAKRFRWLAIRVVALLVIALPSACAAPPSADDLRGTLDAIALPPGITVISEQESGNSMCSPECPKVTRHYSSDRSGSETYQIFATELQRLGYRCETYCTGVDEVTGQSPVSRWRGENEILMVVRGPTGASAMVIIGQ